MQPEPVKKSYSKRNIGIVIGIALLAVVIIGTIFLISQSAKEPVGFGEFVFTGSDSSGYRIAFGIKDSSKQFIAASGTITLEITDSTSSQQLYSQMLSVSPSNFKTLQFTGTASPVLGVSWVIHANQFPAHQTGGFLRFGFATITFTRPDGSSFIDSASLVDLS